MSDFERYAIRLHPKAATDIDEAHRQLLAFSGEEFADDWQDGLRAAISSLATLSKRRPLADENRLFQNDVWVYTYQFRKSRVIYRVLFEAVEKDEDAPYIHVLHIRHASRKPMTRAEAREIEKDE